MSILDERVISMEKAILINENESSSQAGLIVGETREGIVEQIIKDSEKVREGGYEVIEDTEHKFAIRYKRKSWNLLITSTLYWNTMEETLIK